MQLDLFRDSGEVTCRNAVIDALASRDAAAASYALDALIAAYPADSMVPLFQALAARLAIPIGPSLDQAAAADVARAIEQVEPAANIVFAAEARRWLSPFWAQLAAAVGELPFDPHHEFVHAATFFLRAEQWTEADACVDRIPAWYRQPAPLGWKIEATAKLGDIEAVWPLSAEFCWMAPHRVEALAQRLKLPEVSRLMGRFATEFPDAATPDDWTWFPAWALIAYPQLAGPFRNARAGANCDGERCMRLVLSLLSYERQGNRTPAVDVRARLRSLHGGLFALYLQSRDRSAGPPN
jgi:hypothetical protein